MENPMDVIQARSLEERLKAQSEARAVLGAGRPAWASLLQILGPIAAVAAFSTTPGLPRYSQVALTIFMAFVPYAVVEIHLLRRELNAAVSLLRASEARL